MARALIVTGLLLVVLGLLWPLLGKLGLGRLPGDIMVKGEHFRFYFPIVTCLILSVLLSLIFWFFNR